MNDIHKAIGKMITYPVIIFILASMFFNTECNFDPKKAIEGFKNAIPPKETVSRETSKPDTIVIYKQAIEEKPKRIGKGLKLTGSGRTRTTTKGTINYGNGRP